MDYGDQQRSRAPGDPQTSEEQLAYVRGIYSAMQPYDAEEISQAVAHDIEWSLPESLPWGGTHHGHEGIRAIGELFDEHVEGTWTDPEELFDGGDCVIVLGRIRGRSRGSGHEFEVPFAHVWGMSDGVPRWFRGYFDTAPITAALSATEPAGGGP